MTVYVVSVSIQGSEFRPRAVYADEAAAHAHVKSVDDFDTDAVIHAVPFKAADDAERQHEMDRADAYEAQYRDPRC